ncbi:hypothetical protein BOX15_Mlig015929g4 [Macrostomum lignano]|uniref:Uncharacterized protein n=1 Tax=Macrostomum lignano TaxID=282301 RepID=A0A267GF88_9PLAT|nr:hypothetical protein BOX15_Mlig015929g4 [Macrostomum lignano]
MALNVDKEPLFRPLNVEKSLSDKQSLVSKYQTLILTSGEECVGPKRIYIMFKVLDEVLGQLGVFKELFVELRKEMVEAVFSDSIHPGITKDSAEIKRIPHMEEVKRLFKEAKYKEDDHKESVSSMEKKLFEKQQSFEEQLMNNDELAREINERDETITKLMGEIRFLEEDKALIQKEFELYQQSTEKEIQEMKFDYQDLQEELRLVTADRDLCKPYKEGYDKMQIEFQNIGLRAYEDKKSESQKPKPLSQKEKLIADIKAAVKLQDQLLKGQNLLIQEFDGFLEKHKASISSEENREADGRPSTVSTDPSSIRNFEAETADQQLIVNQKRFLENIERIDNEMNLLTKHQVMLEEQLLGMVKANERDGDSVLDLLKTISNAGDPSNDDYVPGDPFVVNERVFSKYSLMLFVSTNGGKTFSEFGGSNYCHQCFEKTTVCPHKLRGREIVLPLPTNASHLRLNRPEVKVNQEVLRQNLQEMRMLERKSGLPPLPKQQGIRDESRTSFNTGLTTETGKSGEPDEKDTRFVNKFSRVWDDYHARTDIVRHHPIKHPKSLIESLIEQFYATCLWDDEYTPDDEEGYSVLDNFYEFLYSRYMQEDVVFLAAHDFFTSLESHAETDDHLRMFSHVLCNNLDGAAFRYFLVLIDLVNQVDFRHSEDFREFVLAAFPFMLEDDVETFQIGFVSYCENRVSRRSVYNYILYMLLRYRDPYFLEMESKCQQSPMAEFGYMSEREFMAVSETVCENAFDHLSRRLFLEAAAAAEREVTTPGTVPVAKLSHILSYLAIIQVAATARDDLADRIARNRLNLKLELRPGADAEEPALRWSYSGALQLARHMAKSEQYRQAHQVSSVE